MVECVGCEECAEAELSAFVYYDEVVLVYCFDEVFLVFVELLFDGVVSLEECVKYFQL